MGGTDEGTAAVEAEVAAPTGIVAMKSALMGDVVLAKGMMKGIIIMKVKAGGTGPQALAIGEDEAEAGALGEGGTAVQLGKAVKRGVPKLNNGIGKENNSKKVLIRLTMMEITTAIIMDICRMEINTMATSSSHLHSKKNIITDPFNSIWFVSSFFLLF